MSFIMELKSLLIRSIFLSGIKYLLFQTVITFIPNTRIILKLIDLTFSTFVLILNFHLASSVTFIDAISLKRVSKLDLFSESHTRLDPELMEALLIFVLADAISHLFELANSFPRRNLEFVRSLLFSYFFVEGFFINRVEIVLLLGIIQNLVSILKYLFCQFSHSQKGVIFLISLISFWLYSFVLVIPFHSFYPTISLCCHKITDYGPKIFRLVLLSYYIVEICLNPITENRIYLEEFKREFFVVSKALKLDTYFRRKNVNNDTPELSESKTGAKTYPMGSSKNTQNKVMMMQMMRCIMSLKKKARRMKKRSKSEGEEGNGDSPIERDQSIPPQRKLN